MTEPKYKICDKVWIFYKPSAYVIKSLEVEILDVKDYDYIVADPKDKSKGQMWKDPEELFPTKQALIDSL